jgi:hypothetical protein
MKAGPKASVDDSPLTGRRVGQGYNAALEIRTWNCEHLDVDTCATSVTDVRDRICAYAAR